jgi:Zn-dependent protease with chaperone function
MRISGGKIFVFTGILKVAQTEEGLAAVLGHEIAHQVARHVGEKCSSSSLTITDFCAGCRW